MENERHKYTWIIVGIIIALLFLLQLCGFFPRIEE